MSKRTTGTDMAAPATIIVLVAGSATFTTEWALAHKIDWKVPLATLLLAAGMEGFSAVDRNGATLLSLLVLLGALTTKWDGYSPVDLISGAVTGTGKLTGSTGQTTTAVK
jgi:hypothetical protein